MKNTAYEINSRKGVRKEKVSEFQIIAIETSQNTKGGKATLAFLLSQAQARRALTLTHLHLLLPPLRSLTINTQLTPDFPQVPAQKSPHLRNPS